MSTNSFNLAKSASMKPKVLAENDKISRFGCRTMIKPNYTATTVKKPTIKTETASSKTTMKRPQAVNSTMMTSSNLSNTSNRYSTMRSSMAQRVPSVPQDKLELARHVLQPKGYTKLNNPIESRRIIESLVEKIDQQTKLLEERELKLSDNDQRLRRMSKTLRVYETIIIRFSDRLCKMAEVEVQCQEQLKTITKLKDEMIENDVQFKNVINNYEDKLKHERMMKSNAETAMVQLAEAHKQEMLSLKESNETKLDALEKEYSSRFEKSIKLIDELDKNLNESNALNRDLVKKQQDLTIENERLVYAMNNDKDARFKYAQEQIKNLQNEVSSLNAVIDIKNEKIKTMENKTSNYDAMTTHLKSVLEQNKTLRQQSEADQVALNNRRKEIEEAQLRILKLTEELNEAEEEVKKMAHKTEVLQNHLDLSSDRLLNESHSSDDADEPQNDKPQHLDNDGIK